ncbi:MAG: DUF692 family protein, partial [Lewinella sp.]|nr:DUF692 family protein [Lewinella sp.]
PLDRVREIHISGGSWERSSIQPDKKIRRDTHDDAVPEAVFQLLEWTIPKCPNLKYVVMEQLGVGLQTEQNRASFREDFLRMKQIVRAATAVPQGQPNDFRPQFGALLNVPLEDLHLYEQQLKVSEILETASGSDDARRRLLASDLAGTDWKVEHWQPDMLETAVRIAQKWREGFK